MYLIAITNWKKKLFYLLALLLIVTLLFTIIPIFSGNNTVNTDSSAKDEDILTQPIKVQSEPVKDNKTEGKK